MSEEKLTLYKCSNPSCGGLDSDRGRGGIAPTVLDCYACGAGQGKAVQEMLNSGIGMFPYVDVGVENFVEDRLH